MSHVFLIGPGGVGKTSVGRILAPLLNYAFVDLDEAFCHKEDPIREFLDSHGYAEYVKRNSLLFYELLVNRTASTVFSLSSGFLVTDVEPEIIARNNALVRQAGTSILLMPSPLFEVSSSIVVERQLRRGLNLERDHQSRTFAARFSTYMRKGHLQIFGSDPPAIIALRVKEELRLHRQVGSNTNVDPKTDT